MTNYFFYCSSYQRFETFRIYPLIQKIRTVAVENEIKTLTMLHLKTFINSEWNDFVKFIQIEIHDHHVEVSFNDICQFINDGFTLKINRNIKLLEHSLQIEDIVIVM